MNIVEINYNHPNETFIQRHVDSLISSGYKPILVARHSDKKLSKLASIGNNKLGVEIMPNFDRMRLREKIYSLRYLHTNPEKIKIRAKIRDRVLLSYFTSLKPSLIHFHFGSLAVMMDWIPKSLGIPYTISLRGSDVQVKPLTSPDYIDKLRDSILGAAGVHSVCDSLWREACNICQIDTEIIYQRTIYTTVPIIDSPKEVSDSKGYKPYHFVSIGRFHWRKAFDNLLIGFRHYLNHDNNAKLTIIGDGPEREALLYWVRDLHLGDKVTLTGKLPYKEFSKILMDCNALIQSSIAEGFSNVTAEAMGMSVPVFATDVGGTSEIIIDGENGFLLDPHNPQDWWEKLKLVQDEVLMKIIGVKAWETARLVFSAEQHAEEFIKFYSGVFDEI